MSKSNNIVFKVLHVVAWIIFIGLCIDAGGMLVNFFFSIFNPEMVGNLYNKLDLTELYQLNKWVFFTVYSMILAIALLKAHLFYIIIELLMKIDLKNPFSSFAAKQISKISYYTLSIGLISFISRQSVKNLEHHGIDISNLNPYWADSSEFIVMAGIIYVISAIFSKGVEIQQENELTV